MTTQEPSKNEKIVNFINVKRTIFLYERCVLAAFSSYMYIEKRRWYEKFVRKMLMKLTQPQTELKMFMKKRRLNQRFSTRPVFYRNL